MNALATLQRLMESCLGDLHLSYCIIYLDDIVIFSKTPVEHIRRLGGGFEMLAAGLKLQPSTCDLFHTRLAYLGHIISENDTETNLKKIDAIKNWCTPTTITEVQRFLGFTDHYRCFIQKYTHIMCPLNLWTTGDNANKIKQMVEWNKKREESFQKLK